MEGPLSGCRFTRQGVAIPLSKHFSCRGTIKRPRGARRLPLGEQDNDQRK